MLSVASSIFIAVASMAMKTVAVPLQALTPSPSVGNSWVGPSTLVTALAPTATSTTTASATPNGHMEGTGKFGSKIALAIVGAVIGIALLGTILHCMCHATKKMNKLNISKPTPFIFMRDLDDQHVRGGAGNHYEAHAQLPSLPRPAASLVTKSSS